MAPEYEVAGILRAYWPQVHGKGNFNSWQLRALDGVKRCRTASLGGHIDGYTNCGQILVHSVIEYLGRYTHKIAISNHRLQDIRGGEVSFTYKDYRDNGKKNIMTLSVVEFTRRFAMHILDKGLVRIRHYGILSNTAKQEVIPLIRAQLPEMCIKNKESANPEPFNPRKCPCCSQNALEKLITFKHRGPPIEYLKERAVDLLLMIA